MPTTYPKCTPTEMLGLLVLLNEHKGVEDLARLAADLDLEIDEILPVSAKTGYGISELWTRIETAGGEKG